MAVRSCRKTSASNWTNDTATFQRQPMFLASRADRSSLDWVCRSPNRWKWMATSLAWLSGSSSRRAMNYRRPPFIHASLSNRRSEVDGRIESKFRDLKGRKIDQWRRRDIHIAGTPDRRGTSPTGR